MEEMVLTPIGTVCFENEDCYIQLKQEYRAGLEGLAEYSHVNILWWFSQRDSSSARSVLTVRSPHRSAPEAQGVFATRSPNRPNPIALSCSKITYLDLELGRLGLERMEAFDQTPVLDLKPYSPGQDRVESPRVPACFAHWPKSYEESLSFDWDAEKRMG